MRKLFLLLPLRFPIYIRGRMCFVLRSIFESDTTRTRRWRFACLFPRFLYRKGIAKGIKEFGETEKKTREKMKRINVSFLLLALMFVVVAFNDAEGKKMQLEEARNAVKNLRKTCAPKSGASKELLDNAAKGDMPPDRKLQCYQKCVLNMMKGMKDDKLRFNVMMSQSDLMLVDEDATRVKNAITKCIPAATSTDGCELAWQFSKCYYETDNEAYFLP